MGNTVASSSDFPYVLYNGMAPSTPFGAYAHLTGKSKAWLEDYLRHNYVTQAVIQHSNGNVWIFTDTIGPHSPGPLMHASDFSTYQRQF